MIEAEKPYPILVTERTAKWRFLAPLIAFAGGIAGLVGAFIEEVLHGGFFGPFVAGPMIEEALKPTGVYLLLARWSHVLRSRLYTAFLSALGGLGFGIIENILYLEVYFPQHSQQLVLWRYTIGLLLHSGCSFIVGFGINQKLIDQVKGDIPFLSANKRYFIIAMVLHSVYNLLAAFVFSKWV
ncbi:MAG: PrsW family glutamic-type intramembrane protease [Chloroflexota bacterium]